MDIYVDLLRICVDDGNKYKFKCDHVSTLEEHVCRDDSTPGQGLCCMGAALCFKVGMANIWSGTGNWLFKSELL